MIDSPKEVSELESELLATHTVEVCQTHDATQANPDPYWHGKCSCGATWMTYKEAVPQCPIEYEALRISDYMRKMQARRKTKSGPRKPYAKRCPCQAMTLKRAQQRNHKCEEEKS